MFSANLGTVNYESITAIVIVFIAFWGSHKLLGIAVPALERFHERTLASTSFHRESAELRQMESGEHGMGL